MGAILGEAVAYGKKTFRNNVETVLMRLSQSDGGLYYLGREHGVVVRDGHFWQVKSCTLPLEA
jgi:hypothetical protein